MNAKNSSVGRVRSRTSKEMKAPLVPPETAEREKAKLRQGRERLDAEATADETSARSSVSGGRLS